MITPLGFSHSAIDLLPRLTRNGRRPCQTQNSWRTSCHLRRSWTPSGQLSFRTGTRSRILSQILHLVIIAIVFLFSIAIRFVYFYLYLKVYFIWRSWKWLWTEFYLLFYYNQYYCFFHLYYNFYSITYLIQIILHIVLHCMNTCFPRSKTKGAWGVKVRPTNAVVQGAARRCNQGSGRGKIGRHRIIHGW